MTQSTAWTLNLDDIFAEMTGTPKFRTPEQRSGRSGPVVLASDVVNSQSFYAALLNEVAVKLDSPTHGLDAYAEERWGRNAKFGDAT